MSAVLAAPRGAPVEDRPEGFRRVVAVLTERGDASAVTVLFDGVLGKAEPA